MYKKKRKCKMHPRGSLQRSPDLLVGFKGAGKDREKRAER